MASAKSLSKATLFVLAVLVINEQCMTELLFPFAPFMVADFNIPVERVGYFVGLIASSFGLLFLHFLLELCPDSSLTIGLTQVLSCYLWGYLSDKFGRKKFLLAGSLINAGTILAFGFSQTLWQAILFHALTGALSGTHRADASIFLRT
jgi:MFS family permease